MLHMDFKQRIVVNTTQQNWEKSPAAGVWRKKLAREEAEQGHATSLVKFEPGSSFTEHDHPLGEEIIVLEGIFSDHTGDYPAGSYLRNPKGFKHAPFSHDGCIIFVKLHQFQKDDYQHICLKTTEHSWRQGQGGLQVMPLHSHNGENTALVKWPAGERFTAHRHFGGEEIFVLQGEFCDEHGRYPQGTWIRSPHLSQHFPFVEEETIIWVKTGHLLAPSAA